MVEPEGRDIHVDTVREEVWHPAYRTAPEPGRKVFVIREADRLNPAAADALLKVLEEPPADAVFLLLSARPHELPETVLSRCHVVTFPPLSESFVVDVLAGEGADPTRARSRRGWPAGTSGAPGGWRATPTGSRSATAAAPRSSAPRRGRPGRSRRPRACSPPPSGTGRA